MGLAFISTGTASGTPATISFTGIDDTYNEYEFHFVNIHAQTAAKNFGFQVNDSGDEGGGFDESYITSSYFVAYNNEAGSDAALSYSSSHDQAQGQAYQTIFHNMDVENKDGCSGILTLYAPASTTYVKHFVARLNGTHHTSEYTMDSHTAGYINDTTAITEISFKMSADNIDAGSIHMYGVG